jgi:hypothetical protein
MIADSRLPYEWGTDRHERFNAEFLLDGTRDLPLAKLFTAKQCPDGAFESLKKLLSESPAFLSAVWIMEYS